MPSSVLALLLAAALQPAQPPSDTLLRLPTLGSVVEDRIRIGQLTGAHTPAGFLIRSPSRLLGSVAPDAPDDGRISMTWLAPELRGVWNSQIPFSLNEGPLWAGRGISARVSAGALATWKSVSLVLAPQLVVEQNRAFQTTSFPDLSSPRARHPLASPFHYPPGSMDLPQRFGHERRVLVDPGQSSLTVRRGVVAFGAATENQWWGPGIRNALLMSAQAPGIPHLFVETAEPLQTPLGALQLRWMVGRLEESDYFDFDASNDHRSLSGLAIVLTPAFDAGLSLGLARTVIAPSGNLPLAAAFDVFRNVGRPAAEPGDTLLAAGPDQLFSVFARWVFPEAGFEVYGEWGRYEQPKSLRDFIELPLHSRGYTVGLQYVRPAGDGKSFRLQTEATSLEPSQSFRVRQLGEWYASRRVHQGYTHRGRVIGAAIGPSGSSQWLALDWLGDDWSVGSFLGRIRWENEALYSYAPEFRRADLSLFPGVRGAGNIGPVSVQADYTYGVRLNYMFQSWRLTNTTYRGVDLRNHTLALTLSTRAP